MRLTLTVLDRGRSPEQRRHVIVDAPCGTRFGEVRDELATVVGVPGGEFVVEGRRVTDDDVLGRAPLLRAALLTVPRAGDAHEERRAREPAGAVALRIESGVGAGRIVWLGRGEHVIGRAASARVRLDDPGISRVHALVHVRPDGIEVCDLEPTNPSLLDGDPLPPEGSRLTEGQRLRVGRTTLVLGSPSVTPGRHEVADGQVRVHRPPRFREERPPVCVRFPDEPRRPEHSRMPLLASTVPVVLSAVLAVALASPALLLFALMSPVLLIGQWWSDRRAGRTSHRRQQRSYADQVGRARQALERAARDDAARRRQEQPDLAELAAVVCHRGTRLWERRPDDPDHLLVRVGSATRPARVDRAGHAPDPAPSVDDVPVLVDLATSGVVGIAGPAEHAMALAGAVLLQVATWHTPRHVAVHVLTSTRDRVHEWEWVTHLPHVCDHDDPAPRISGGETDVSGHLAALQALAWSRCGAEDPVGATGPAPPPDVVVLVDGASALRSLRGLVDLLGIARRAGLVFVCVERDARSLPAETCTTVEIDEAGLSASVRDGSGTLEGVAPDLPSPGWLETVSRAMAPLVDATPDHAATGLPREVSFVGLHRAHGIDPVTAQGVANAWARGDGRPVALLGRAADGPFRIDLAADGPHVLIGGTTGSGKSELLQALVAGLAMTTRPDELAFVLVDYKGGSAFSDCARLPHTVGLVTDLDARLTSRALTSLDAEMKRRERLLADAGCKDVDDYRVRSRVCRDLPPLARLVIVVDEFKALAEEFPDFIAGLVRVAALGRSLGLHLVLATQRPAGIVSADMRANIALRIALRVRDRTDSDDVVDAKDAAALDARSPGRACVRAGDQALTTVQTAYLGRPLPTHDTQDAAVRVAIYDLLDSPTPPVERTSAASAASGSGCPTELQAVVAAAMQAAEALGIEAPPPPWLPALPTTVTAADLDATRWDSELVPNTDGATGIVHPRRRAAHVARVPLGLVDVPAEQRHEVLTWDLATGGHLGIAGGSRSGRSTTLAAVAVRLAESNRPDDVHLHVLQGVPGPCAALSALPHAGTVTSAMDPTVMRRLLTRLVGMVAGTDSVAGADPRPTHTVVIVDGWESVEEALSTIDHGAPLDDLHRLLRDGPVVGMRFAVAGGRAVISGRLPGLLQQRLVLHLPDPLDLTLAGIDPAVGAATRPPGRAIDVRSGREVQLAVAGEDGSPTATAAAIAIAIQRQSLVADSRREGPIGPAPWRLSPLPADIDLGALPADPDGVVVGVGGDGARPLVIALGPGRQRLLVAGPSRSGRSNAMSALASRLLEQGRRILVVAPRRGGLGVWAQAHGCEVLTPRVQPDAVLDRAHDPDVCVLVDDLELVEGSPVEPALLEVARIIDGTGGVIVVAAQLSRANAAFRGLVPEVARDGCGILLGPTSPTDGDVLGVRLDLPLERRPGRGFLVVDGLTEPFQVARVDDGDGVRPSLASRGLVYPPRAS